MAIIKWHPLPWLCVSSSILSLFFYEECEGDLKTEQYAALRHRAFMFSFCTSQPDYVAARQICFYTNRNRTPGLILQPAKVEVAWVRPTVLLYRDMVSDSEIERLKELATPKVGMFVGPVLQPSSYKLACTRKCLKMGIWHSLGGLCYPEISPLSLAHCIVEQSSGMHLL